MLKSFEDVRALLTPGKKRRMGVVAAQDQHTLEAAAHAAADGLVEPVLYGQAAEIARIWEETAPDQALPEIVSCSDEASTVLAALADVRSGALDCLMKGKIETGVLMKQVVNRETGIRRSKVLSAIAMVESPNYHKVFAISDIALMTYPNLEQKRGILENAVGLMHALGVEVPKAAVLAAVEKVNPKMPETVDAAALKELNLTGELTGCQVEGPISLDLCVDREAAQIKGYNSPVAGDPDILIVPDIVAGNLLIKSLTCLGGASSFGYVAGAQVPIVITSRSSPSQDKYRSIVLAAAVGRQ